jgi:hypothetical protein
MSDSFLTTLRKPRVNIFDISISLFDLSGTLLISYLIARQFELNIPLVMISSIPLGYLTHEYFKISTPLTDKINETLQSTDSKIN